VHYDIPVRDRTISFQVTTLPDVAGGESAPSHVYRFMLDLPIPIPPYFAELQANTLPTGLSDSSPDSDHHRGWFHPDPDRRLLALVLGSPTADEPMAAFTQHTLFVPHDVFLSHISAHSPSPSPSVHSGDGATAAEAAIIAVPWNAWGPGNTMLTTVPHAFRRSTGLHKVCGMHALGKLRVIRDRNVLRITDYHPHRVAHERARAAQRDDTGADLDDNPAEQEQEQEQEGQEWQRLDDGTTPGTEPHNLQIPYVEKDIPLPDGLRSEQVRCVLGEDAVFLIQVGFFCHTSALVNGRQRGAGLTKGS
jgi:hypothetical protein